MRAYCDGDATAFNALYVRHEGRLYRFVRRVLGQALSAQADDVFQDCWLRIVSARESFSAERGRWSTWAFAIAHNLAMDRLRTSGREVSYDIDGPADTHGSGHEGGATSPLAWLQHDASLAQPGTEDLSHWRAAGRQLLNCIDALPPAQRAAFLLHHEDGLSVEAVADTLALGFETVKSQMRYALHKLRRCMQVYLQWEGAT